MNFFGHYFSYTAARRRFSGASGDQRQKPNVKNRVEAAVDFAFEQPWRGKVLAPKRHGG